MSERIESLIYNQEKNNDKFLQKHLENFSWQKNARNTEI